MIHQNSVEFHRFSPRPSNLQFNQLENPKTLYITNLLTNKLTKPQEKHELNHFTSIKETFMTTIITTNLVDKIRFIVSFFSQF